MNHTPGPWRACGSSRLTGKLCNCGQIWSEPTDAPVATANTTWGDGPDMVYGEIPEKEMHANARLMAAAPDLLQACLDFVAKVDAGNAISTRSYAQMKAAIEKATQPTPTPEA